jgi:hypothetical protein
MHGTKVCLYVSATPSLAPYNRTLHCGFVADESRPRAAEPPHPVVPGAKKWGTSEYKMKFVGYVPQERAVRNLNFVSHWYVGLMKGIANFTLRGLSSPKFPSS